MSTSTDGQLGELAQYFVSKGEAQGEARGEARGEAHGRAVSVLAVLDARGIEVSPDVRRDVLECRDIDRLDAWMRRAVTARSAADLDG